VIGSETLVNFLTSNQDDLMVDSDDNVALTK